MAKRQQLLLHLADQITAENETVEKGLEQSKKYYISEETARVFSQFWTFSTDSTKFTNCARCGAVDPRVLGAARRRSNWPKGLDLSILINRPRFVIRYAFLYFVTLAFLNCSTLKSYLENRALDTADILTLSVEEKVAGVNIKPCLSNIGLQFAQYGQGYGLRAGSIGAYATGANNKYYNSGNSYLLLNSVHHNPVHPHFRNNKIKAFNESNSLAIGIFDWHGYNFATQCEISLGVYYGVRAGFNIAELGDWFLGWFTIDYLEDDLH